LFVLLLLTIVVCPSFDKDKQQKAKEERQTTQKKKEERQTTQ
jgi:hypothetical protein